MTPMNSKMVVIAQNTNTSGVSAITGTVDTKGFSFAKIVGLSSSTASVASGTNVKIEEGDTTSSFATFAGFIQGTDWTGSTATGSTANAHFIAGVPLIGRKRYLKVTFSQGATAVSNVILAELDRASDSPNSVSEGGANNGIGF